MTVGITGHYVVALVDGSGGPVVHDERNLWYAVTRKVLTFR